MPHTMYSDFKLHVVTRSTAAVGRTSIYFFSQPSVLIMICMGRPTPGVYAWLDTIHAIQSRPCEFKIMQRGPCVHSRLAYPNVKTCHIPGWYQSICLCQSLSEQRRHSICLLLDAKPMCALWWAASTPPCTGVFANIWLNFACNDGQCTLVTGRTAWYFDWIWRVQEEVGLWKSPALHSFRFFYFQSILIACSRTCLAICLSEQKNSQRFHHICYL